MAKPKTHIEDPTQDAPKGAAWTLCGLFGPRELVDNADPSCQKCLRYRHFASPDERPSRAKGRLKPSGSPRSNFLNRPARPLPAAGWTSWYPPRSPASSEVVNLLFPQACVNLGSFPRPFTTTLFNPVSTIHHDNCPKSSTIHHDIHIVKTSRRFTSSRSGYSCG